MIGVPKYYTPDDGRYDIVHREGQHGDAVHIIGRKLSEVAGRHQQRRGIRTPRSQQDRGIRVREDLPADPGFPDETGETQQIHDVILLDKKE